MVLLDLFEPVGVSLGGEGGGGGGGGEFLESGIGEDPRGSNLQLACSH